MTTVIDHAIAIPTRPANVWEIVRDIDKNPIWHPDSQRVQFLTTNKRGRGTRWRNTTPTGKEQVYEITAWYDGLGYEYRIVDGSAYPKNRGRVRLQEAPEGTVLQWTFSYEISGMFGQLRNRMSMRGQADKKIIQGLRTLYSHVKDLKADEVLTPEESKSYLKEAPNVEERAKYQPRYPSKLQTDQIAVVTQETAKIDEDAPFKPPAQGTTPAASAPIIEEPPIADDDTRPNPAIQRTPADSASPAPSSASDEPDFLKTMPDPLPQPNTAPAIEPAVDSEPEPTVSTSTGIEQETVSASAAEPNLEESELSETATHDTEQATAPTIPSPTSDEPTLATSTEGQHKPETEPLIEEPDPSKLDTSQISVFDLFGLEKPSESQAMKAITDEDIEEALSVATTDTVTSAIADAPETETRKAFMDSTPIIPDITPDLPEKRRGLRAALRRRQMKLRIPK